MIVGTCKVDRSDIRHSDDPRETASSFDEFWSWTVTLELTAIMNQQLERASLNLDKATELERGRLEKNGVFQVQTAEPYGVSDVWWVFNDTESVTNNYHRSYSITGMN